MHNTVLYVWLASLRRRRRGSGCEHRRRRRGRALRCASCRSPRARSYCILGIQSKRKKVRNTTLRTTVTISNSFLVYGNAIARRFSSTWSSTADDERKKRGGDQKRNFDHSSMPCMVSSKAAKQGRYGDEDRPTMASVQQHPPSRKRR